MVPRCVPAAALAALLACLPSSPAAAAGGALVAQITQAQAEPTLPPLTDAPEGLGEEPEPAPEPEATPTPGPRAEPGPQLPATGADAGLVALAGLGLLVGGAGLRRTADELLES